MGIVVQKYGGTSVGNVERIKNVAKRIQKTVQEGTQVVVVVSAMGDQTDELISLMNQVTKKPPRREMDMILTTGEQISIALLSTALQELDVPSISYTGWQAGIETESEFGNARILDINPKRIYKSLKEGKVVIVAGFQGITEKEEIATLGRGGSDTSAVALAVAVKADYCEINTDVEGVYSTDPRIVPKARKLPAISHDEMLEMATLGASVLHPRAVELAKVHGVKILVRSSFSDKEGTYIKEANEMEQENVVSGIAYDTDVIKIDVLNMPNKVDTISSLFDSLASEKINVDMIVLSDRGTETFNLSFSVSIEDAERTIKTLKQHESELLFTDAFYEKDVAKVSIIGSGMSIHPGVAAKMFQTLSNEDIQIKMITTSEIKVSCIIPEEKGKNAVKILHSAFDLDTTEKAKVEA
ncbi:aspartate kinase [Alkalihalobacillus sp. BA299]|uniref:aspartate kinase n=1 Tax=Alkalihalobacillus sp. BA299 TaxID=2815938 RepID=UPI001ADC9617|nr:aspartate kinase [Alkalihalobacillus sp. BA299]